LADTGSPCILTVVFGIKDVQDFFATNVHYCIGTVWTVLLPCPSCDAEIMSLSSPHAPAKPLYHNCSSSHLLVQMDLFSFKNWYQELLFVPPPPHLPATSLPNLHLARVPSPLSLGAVCVHVGVKLVAWRGTSRRREWRRLGGTAGVEAREAEGVEAEEEKSTGRGRIS